MTTPQFATTLVPQEMNGNGKVRTQDSIYLGDCIYEIPPKDIPRRLPRKRGTPLTVALPHFLDGHVLFRGKTRSGKTQKQIAPLVQSLIPHPGPIFLFDFKGDKELYHRVKRAGAPHRTVRWFSPDPNRSFAFNPFQAVSKHTTRAIRIANVWTEGLNLQSSGKDSKDTQFFSGQNLLQILRLVQASMQDVSGGSNTQEITLTHINKYLSQKEYQVEHANQLLTTLEQLESSYPQLLPAENPAHNISLRNALLNNEVIIFSLPALSAKNS